MARTSIDRKQRTGLGGPTTSADTPVKVQKFTRTLLQDNTVVHVERHDPLFPPVVINPCPPIQLRSVRKHDPLFDSRFHPPVIKIKIIQEFQLLINKIIYLVYYLNALFN